MSACRSCGAEIRWTVTEAGRKMPIDPEPVEEGNIVLRDPPPGAVAPLALLVPIEAFEDEPRYVSHFATCPEAKEWRRRTGGTT